MLQYGWSAYLSIHPELAGMPPPQAEKQTLPYPTRTINAVIHQAARLCIGGDSRRLTR
jgi:hypothetical protein